MAEDLPQSLHRVVSLFSTRAAGELRDPVDAGAIPEVGAFDFDHHHVSLALDGVTLGGLETLEPVRVNWSRDDGTVRAALTVSTSQASLRGAYRVAESAVSEGALRMAASLAGTDLAGGVTDAVADTQLASWFREQELRRSENGRVLTGMYAAHEDTINTLMVGKSTQSGVLRKALKRNETKDTTKAVRASTYAHRGRKLFGGSLEAPDVPPIGDAAHFQSSLPIYKALLDSAKAEAGTHDKDPANEYAKLLNSMRHFNCAVDYVRKKYPGRHTPQEILQFVADTPQGEIPCGATIAENAISDEAPLWPLDREYFLRADAARTERHDARLGTPAQGSTFADEAVGIELEISMLVTADAVVLEELRPRVTMLRIRLNGAGESEVLSRLDAFAGETAFYIDLIRTRIAAALGDVAFVSRLARTLA